MLNGTQADYDVISQKPKTLSSADSVLTRCKYFYAKKANSELRYFSLNKWYIIMNTELFKVLNKNNWIVEFWGNCHGILVRLKEICCRQLLLMKNCREERSFAPQ